MSTPPRETIQKQIQQDWANREYIEVITGSIKKITDFLNSFDMSCRSRLATLNEKLTSLERKIDYLEACTDTSPVKTAICAVAKTDYSVAQPQKDVTKGETLT